MNQGMGCAFNGLRVYAHVQTCDYLYVYDRVSMTIFTVCTIPYRWHVPMKITV